MKFTLFVPICYFKVPQARVPYLWYNYSSGFSESENPAGNYYVRNY